MARRTARVELGPADGWRWRSPAPPLADTAEATAAAAHTLVTSRGTRRTPGRVRTGPRTPAATPDQAVPDLRECSLPRKPQHRRLPGGVPRPRYWRHPHCGHLIWPGLRSSPHEGWPHREGLSGRWVGCRVVGNVGPTLTSDPHDRCVVDVGKGSGAVTSGAVRGPPARPAAGSDVSIPELAARHGVHRRTVRQPVGCGGGTPPGGCGSGWSPSIRRGWSEVNVSRYAAVVGWSWGSWTERVQTTHVHHAHHPVAGLLSHHLNHPLSWSA